MKTQSFLKAFLVIAVATCLWGSVQAQKIVMREVDQVTQLDITKEAASTVDFGQTSQGLMTRCNFSFTNPYSESIKVVQVRTGDNLFPGRQEGLLEFVEVKPGETYDFFVLAKGDEVGPVSGQIELVIEQNGRRFRRATFQLNGTVTEAH